MKKIVSLALALAMLCCMATTAFAVAETDGHKHIVGSYKTNNTVADGADGSSFTDPNVEVSITVTTGSVESRYAVDIDYDTMTLNVSGANLVWDVNKLDYVAKDGSPAATKPAEKVWFGATVTNYSDNAVYVTATVNDIYTDANDDGIGVAIVAAKDSEVAKTITHQELGDAKSGTAQALPFAVMVSCADWDAAAAYHTDNQNSAGGTVKVATCNILVEKA